MKRYVVGFVFNDELADICLIRKTHPAWQAGCLNGVGGGIEEGETDIQAMVREFAKEAGVATAAEAWAPVAILQFPYAEIAFFALRSTEAYLAAASMTEEEVVKLPVAALTAERLVANALPLVQLSLQRLVDRQGVAPVDMLAGQAELERRGSLAEIFLPRHHRLITEGAFQGYWTRIWVGGRLCMRTELNDFLEQPRLDEQARIIAAGGRVADPAPGSPDGYEEVFSRP